VGIVYPPGKLVAKAVEGKPAVFTVILLEATGATPPAATDEADTTAPDEATTD
jgi:hypothetical protein